MTINLDVTEVGYKLLEKLMACYDLVFDELDGYVKGSWIQVNELSHPTIKK